MNLIGYIVLGLAAFLLSFQLYAWWDAKRARGRHVPTGGALGIPERGRALIYFHSKHCMACRHMTPVVAALAETHSNICCVDARENPDVAAAYTVRGTPTLVLITDGAIEQILIGARSEAQIRGLLTAA